MALASGLELGFELGATVYLDGLHGEGRARLEVVQEESGSVRRCPRIDAEHVPARDDVAGGEVLENDSW